MQYEHEASLILVGICSGAVGVRGEIKVRTFTDNPERFNSGNRVIIRSSQYIIERLRIHRSQLIVKFSGVDSADDAFKLNNENICVQEEEVVSLPEGQYYHFQLLGMNVRNIAGDQLGAITEILTTGANDVYVVTGTAEILVPAISGVIVSVDISVSEMVVDLPDGL